MKFTATPKNAYSRAKSLFEKLFASVLSAIFFALTFCLSACGAGVGEQKHFTAFKNTDVTVQAREKTLSAAAEKEITDLLSRLNSEFSATVTESTTYKINSAAASEETEISEEFRLVAKECQKMRLITRGKFDPSVYPLTLLWKFAPNYPDPDFSVPTDDEILTTKTLVGFDKFSFENSAIKTLDGAKLDFGGVLKGYAADKIAQIMKADGITKGYVNVGGSSLYLLSVDNLYIVHPRKKDNILKIKINSADLSVSTSGDYEKNYQANGKIYSHIIDPATGHSSESGVASATVIGKNGLYLDAVTTALNLFTHDFSEPENGELFKFVKELLNSEEFKDAQIFVVCIRGDQKQILTNKKQGEDFTLSDNEYSVINVN